MTKFGTARMGGLLGLSLLAACAQGTMPMHDSMAMPASGPVQVGGSPMLPSRDIVDNAVNSRDHTTLVSAVQAAGLVPTLKGPGPFTVFAPTNAAFSALPPQTVPTLLRPENKPMLTGVLTYHVVPGALDYAALAERIRAGGGTAMLTTVQGAPLTIMMNGPHNIEVKDVADNIAHITTYDVRQSNGVIHVVDHVLIPHT